MATSLAVSMVVTHHKRDKLPVVKYDMSISFVMKSCYLSDSGGIRLKLIGRALRSHKSTGYKIRAVTGLGTRDAYFSTDDPTIRNHIKGNSRGKI